MIFCLFITLNHTNLGSTQQGVLVHVTSLDDVDDGIRLLIRDWSAIQTLMFVRIENTFRNELLDTVLLEDTVQGVLSETQAIVEAAQLLVTGELIGGHAGQSQVKVVGHLEETLGELLQTELAGVLQVTLHHLAVVLGVSTQDQHGLAQLLNLFVARIHLFALLRFAGGLAFFVGTGRSLTAFLGLVGCTGAGIAALLSRSCFLSVALRSGSSFLLHSILLLLENTSRAKEEARVADRCSGTVKLAVTSGHTRGGTRVHRRE
mmetsp:Transcript_1834/g.5715  ORF Transcript_1834/g.5715 Transcript_1834/m.5715 type:complete len:262 (+) Transcript_1834:15-800(+)